MTDPKLTVENLRLDREKMMEQRKHTLPQRWFGPCERITDEQRRLLMVGKWQGMIPVKTMTAEEAMAEIWGLTCPDCGPNQYALIVKHIAALIKLQQKNDDK